MDIYVDCVGITLGGAELVRVARALVQGLTDSTDQGRGGWLWVCGAGGGGEAPGTGPTALTEPSVGPGQGRAKGPAARRVNVCLVKHNVIGCNYKGLVLHCVPGHLGEEILQ